MFTATFLVVCLATTLVASAPTEVDTSTSTEPSTSSGQSEGRAVAPGANMVSAHAHLANSSFTCLNRQVGYYADMEAECKVYHFCLLGDYNGQEVYQRVSYMCVNETVFDQRALDCVEASKMSGPCSESEKIYDESNAALRKAITGQSAIESDKKATEEKTADKTAEEKAAEEKKAQEKKEAEKKEEEEQKEKEEEKKEDEKEKKEEEEKEKKDD